MASARWPWDSPRPAKRSKRHPLLQRYRLGSTTYCIRGGMVAFMRFLDNITMGSTSWSGTHLPSAACSKFIQMLKFWSSEKIVSKRKKIVHAVWGDASKVARTPSPWLSGWACNADHCCASTCWANKFWGLLRGTSRTWIPVQRMFVYGDRKSIFFYSPTLCFLKLFEHFAFFIAHGCMLACLNDEPARAQSLLECGQSENSVPTVDFLAHHVLCPSNNRRDSHTRTLLLWSPWPPKTWLLHERMSHWSRSRPNSNCTKAMFC